MITVQDIVAKWLKENGYNGLWHDEGPCGCDGSAPCGEPNYDCCAAFEGPGGEDADGQLCDSLYYVDPRSMEDLEKDQKNQARTFSAEEIELHKMIGEWKNSKKDKDKCQK